MEVREMAHYICERKQENKATVAFLIGIIAYAVATYALLPTILAERTPPMVAAMATMTSIDDMIHSPSSTTLEAIAQTTPTFLLVTFYVGMIVTWLEVVRLGISIVRRLDAS
jgi:hypothetical protein